ncbi:hypothetical protein [Povalibacter sp.]|uniref:hypothetical protein n=1 Tax=Povalibacter sp. TaxID=1962978 RepID=UPI002F416CE7
MTMHVAMKDFAQDGLLAGKAEGKAVFAHLVQLTKNPPQPDVCFLDFSGIDIATTSFLRESIVAYRTYVRREYPNVYPIAANLSSRARDDLELILELRSDAYVVCVLSPDGEPSDVELLGQLDGKQLIALDAVLEAGEADAPTLAERNDEGVGATAWNNRLVALADKGILIATNAGRTKLYRPVLEGLRHGS